MFPPVVVKRVEIAPALRLGSDAHLVYIYILYSGLIPFVICAQLTCCFQQVAGVQ